MNVGADTGEPRRDAGKKQRRVIVDDDDSDAIEIGIASLSLSFSLHFTLFLPSVVCIATTVRTRPE